LAWSATSWLVWSARWLVDGFFSALRIATPIGGVAGNIVVAFVGALVLLVLFRFLKPGRRFA
jgi:uncharacterized membrane protein YeaQ/YmgE (transglycosylase-associated protein family)